MIFYELKTTLVHEVYSDFLRNKNNFGKWNILISYELKITLINKIYSVKSLRSNVTLSQKNNVSLYLCLFPNSTRTSMNILRTTLYHRDVLRTFVQVFVLLGYRMLHTMTFLQTIKNYYFSSNGEVRTSIIIFLLTFFSSSGILLNCTFKKIPWKYHLLHV